MSMILLLLSGAAHAENVSATLAKGVTAAAVQAARAPIDVASFPFHGATWTVRCQAVSATTVHCTADQTGRSVPVTRHLADTAGTTVHFADPALKDARVRLDGIVLHMDAEDGDE